MSGTKEDERQESPLTQSDKTDTFVCVWWKATTLSTFWTDGLVDCSTRAVSLLFWVVSYWRALTATPLQFVSARLFYLFAMIWHRWHRWVEFYFSLNEREGKKWSNSTMVSNRITCHQSRLPSSWQHTSKYVTNPRIFGSAHFKIWRDPHSSIVQAIDIDRQRRISISICNVFVLNRQKENQKKTWPETFTSFHFISFNFFCCRFPGYAKGIYTFWLSANSLTPTTLDSPLLNRPAATCGRCESVQFNYATPDSTSVKLVPSRKSAKPSA